MLFKTNALCIKSNEDTCPPAPSAKKYATKINTKLIMLEFLLISI